MRVTDPAIIEKLNAMQQQKRVTDPDIISRLNAMHKQGTNKESENQKHNIQNPMEDQQQFSNNAIRKNKETLSPGLLGFPQPEKPRTLGGELSSASLAIPGGGLLSKVLPKAMPALSKSIANYAGDIAQNAGIGGALSALEGKDALKGAESSGLATAAISPVIGGAAKIAGAFQPQKTADKIVEYLGGGKSLSENLKELADTMKTSFKSAQNEAKTLYDPVIKHSGLSGHSIYREINPSGIHAFTERPEYKLEGIQGKLKKSFDEFNKNPSLENAHRLQSQLGRESQNIQYLQPPGTPTKYDLIEMRQNIKNDISSFLESKNPEIAKKYEQASEHYATNVAPYLDNNRIRQLVKNKSPKIDNIFNVFKNPNEGIEKIASDIGTKGQNSILYAALKQNKENVTANKLMQSMSKLDEKGFGGYMHPELEGYFKQLSNQMRNKELLQRAGGLFAGGQIGKTLGMPGGELLGSALGAMKAPQVLGMGKKKYSSNIESKHIEEALKKLSRLPLPGAQ